MKERTKDMLFVTIPLNVVVLFTIYLIWNSLR